MTNYMPIDDVYNSWNISQENLKPFATSCAKKEILEKKTNSHIHFYLGRNDEGGTKPTNQPTPKPSDGLQKLSTVLCSRPWCLNPEGVAGCGTLGPIHLAPLKEGPGIDQLETTKMKTWNFPGNLPCWLLFFSAPKPHDSS